MTVALLVIAARGVDWHETWAAIRDSSPALLAIAAAANVLTLLFKAVRWWLFLSATGVESLGLVVRATLAGAALNSVLVANGGDAARVAGISRRTGVSSAAILATLAVDRACDLITYVLLFAIAALVLPLPPELARWRGPGALVLLALVVIIALIVWRGRHHGQTSAAEVADSASLFDRARAYVRRLMATTASVTTVRRMIPALGLSLLGWAGQWATFHYAARAAALPISPSESLLALLAVNASFLIRLTPGNVGVFQLLYALVAESAGLDRDRALAVAFLINAIQYIPVVVIGLPFAPSLARGRDARVAPHLSNSGQR